MWQNKNIEISASKYENHGFNLLLSDVQSSCSQIYVVIDY